MARAWLIPRQCTGNDPKERTGVGEKVETGASVRAGKLRVLIVEDEVLLRLEAQYALQSAGFEIAGVAWSADQSVEIAAREKPDLVLMDIRLAGARDGIDAACEIRSRLGIASIFVTAHGDPDTVARAQSAKPVGFLTKPYTISGLTAAVNDALKRRPGAQTPRCRTTRL